MVVANRAHADVPKVYQYPRPPEHNVRPQHRPHRDFRLLRRIAAGILVVALALLVVYRYGEISQINMDINRATNTRKALADEQRHLQISVAQLTALDRIEKFALEELGMQYPLPGQYKYVGYQNPESGDEDGE